MNPGQFRGLGKHGVGLQAQGVSHPARSIDFPVIHPASRGVLSPSGQKWGHSTSAIIQVNWSIHYYSDAVQAEVLAMPAGFVARYFRYADRMELFGPDLGMPHTRAMGRGLFELRIKAVEGIARVFFCAIAGRRIMVLHLFTKKSEKTPPRELRIAMRRMKEVINAQS